MRFYNIKFRTIKMFNNHTNLWNSYSQQYMPPPPTYVYWPMPQPEEPQRVDSNEEKIEKLTREVL